MKLIVLSLFVATALAADSRCPTVFQNQATLLAHETDCRKFYTCSFGKAHEMECGENLSFDAELHVCGYMTETCQAQLTKPQWEKPATLPFYPWPQYPQIKPDPQNPPQIQPYPPTIPKPPSQQGKPMNPQYPQYPQYPQNPQYPQAKPDYRCQNSNPQNPTYLPNPADCQSYFVCDFGLAKPAYCPQGQHWNVQRNYCDWPQNANCNSQGWTTAPTFPSWPPTTGKCPVYDNPQNPVHLPHEWDCSKFYACRGGYPVQKDCPPGQHWNAQRNYCDWPEQAGCKKW